MFENVQGKLLDCPDYHTENLARILRKSGVKNGNLHVLEHLFVSEPVAAEGDWAMVKELAGHASVMTTVRYAHLSPDHKASAVELVWSGAIADTKRIHSNAELSYPSRSSLGYNSRGRI